MLEQVLALQLQDMALDLPRPHETRATRWAHVMARGGGRRPVSWGTLFREWLECLVIFIEDWPYASMDFHRDPDMQLPTGEQLDDGGKTLNHIIFAFYFL